LQIFNYIKIIIALYFLAGCASNPVSQPTLSPEQILRLEQSDYPTGWRLLSLNTGNDWLADSEYVQFFSADLTSNPTESLSSFLYFLQYRNTEEAARYYQEYENRVFSLLHLVTSWTQPENLNPKVQYADRYSVRCATATRQPNLVLENCQFWAQYGRCLIKFHSHIRDQIMSYRTFQELVESKIDSKMEIIDACYST
jgi:hypothetical protein